MYIKDHENHITPSIQSIGYKILTFLKKVFEMNLFLADFLIDKNKL